MGIWIDRLNRLLFEEKVYSIGIRSRGARLLFEGEFERPFSVMPITTDEWYADPIVFNWQGNNYLFCEVYNRSKNKGAIGVTLLDCACPQKPKVCLEIETHLSYPMVFEQDGCVYMIPETTSQKNMMLFCAKEFPYKWEFVCELLIGEEYADTTVYQNSGETILFTFQHFKGNGNIVKIHYFKLSSLTSDGFQEFETEEQLFSNQIRGAGHFFQRNNKLIRPSQDCSKEYGYALNFMEVTSVMPPYQEKLIAKVLPEKIMCNPNYNVLGIHTYAITDRYEIIDVKFNDVVFSHQVKKLKNYIARHFLGSNSNYKKY